MERSFFMPKNGLKHWKYWVYELSKSRCRIKKDIKREIKGI